MKDKIFYNNKGAELSALGKYDEAESCFKQALELEPWDCSREPTPCDYMIMYNIGYVLLKKGDKKEYVKWFDQAFGNAAKENKGFLALDCGLACYGVGLYEEAEKYYGLAFSFGESSAEYWNRVGVLSFVTESYEKAKECFEKAVSLEPDHADALYNLADTYDELGLPEKAAEARAKYSALAAEEE
ncbi:MAG: tetratricopeptide repeat protein [Spirochaetes bacterium]|nr:tetratricopeptide repeat protein [Spirochaetota bacterium]